LTLVTDPVRGRCDIGKVPSTTVAGGDSFGHAATVITCYVVQITGGFDNVFDIAGCPPRIEAAGPRQ
jgi:hypothetical protein